MTLMNRIELETKFKNGTRPSQQDFADLIGSMLNKRDDQFMGTWKPGTIYRKGDVVVYKRALWEVKTDGEICSHTPPEEDEDTWQSLIVPVEDDDWVMVEPEDPEASPFMYANMTFECIGIGTELPRAKLEVLDAGKGLYLLNPKAAEGLTFSLVNLKEKGEKTYLVTCVDADHVVWASDVPGGFRFVRGVYCEEGKEDQIDCNEGEALVVFVPDDNSRVRVGIGTDKPGGMLDVTDGKKGQFLLIPEDKKDPAFTIVNLDPHCDKNYLAMGVGLKNAVFVTDAPRGFVFKQGKEYGEYCNEGNINQGDPLVIILANDDHQPKVGIGTEDPSAMLDVTDGKKGQFLLIPEDKKDPAFTIVNLDPGSDKNYLATGVGAERAVFVTDAPDGFAFNQGGEYGEFCNDGDINQGQTWVVIKADGRVGMGTEEPYTRLEIAHEASPDPSGRFLFNLEKKVNPALAIVNLRGGDTEESNNYLTLGADNDKAVFVTDSRYGFIFRKGGEYGTNDHEIDINQGDDLIRIRPDGVVTIMPDGGGKLGIGMTPEDYHLDLNGLMRAYNVYLNTDQSNVYQPEELGDVLEKIKRLRPITFHWDQGTGLAGEGKQIGLLAHEVDDFFPEVVKTNTVDMTKAVAYQNLVPVLIKGLQEQQELIEQQQEALKILEKRLDEIEGRVEHCEGQLGDTEY